MPVKPRERRREKAKRLPPVDSNQRYEIPEASTYLRQSVAKTYLDVRAGKLAVIKDGGRTYIPGSEIIKASTLPSQAA